LNYARSLARARLYTTQIASETSEMAWKSLVTSYPLARLKCVSPKRRGLLLNGARSTPNDNGTPACELS